MADVNQITGKTVLWVGQEAEYIGDAGIIQAARFAREHGIDSICAKVADGSIRWYKTVENLRYLQAQVHALGCGFIPFIYCYGPALSDHQTADECAVLKEMMGVCSLVQADMETEWDGQVGAAEEFERLMRPVPGMLSISTWADPNQQNWAGVIRALGPCVNAWTPQDYTNWLSWQEWQQRQDGMTLIQPGIDITGEFGADDVLGIVRQARANGHTSLYIWEYRPALRDPGLMDQIAAIMGDRAPIRATPPSSQTPPATPAPASVADVAPTPPREALDVQTPAILSNAPVTPPEANLTDERGYPRSYVVGKDETLSSIAQKVYGDAAGWAAIWLASRSYDGEKPYIFEGMTLTIPAPPAPDRQVGGPTILD